MVHFPIPLAVGPHVELNHGGYIEAFSDVFRRFQFVAVMVFDELQLIELEIGVGLKVPVARGRFSFILLGSPQSCSMASWEDGAKGGGKKEGDGRKLELHVVVSVLFVLLLSWSSKRFVR